MQARDLAFDSDRPPTAEGDLRRTFGALYDELKRLAKGQKRRAWMLDTLNTTALVHETYLKLMRSAEARWHDGAHFRAIASTAMRQLLLNYAEQARAKKRGGDWHREMLVEDIDETAPEVEALLDVSRALEDLEEESPRLARVVECRFFGGMNEAEIAAALCITERTVRRDWVRARAWLACRLTAGRSAAGIAAQSASFGSA